MAITRLDDYDRTPNFGEGYKAVPKGGYIARILQAEETADKNGRPLVHIAFDIIEGEYSNHFMDLFRGKKDRAEDPTAVKWPFEGQAWIHVFDYKDPKKTSSKFKGFCTALEESGTQVWANNNFLLGNLKGAQIGVIYQNQEQPEYNGKTFWKAVPWGFRSTEVIDSGEYYVPNDKPLANKGGNYGSSTNSNSSFGFSQQAPQEDLSGFGSVDDEVPF